MFLVHQPSGELVEILTLDTLFDPCRHEVMGQSHAGEELQDPDTFAKQELRFPSGEALPRCWVEADYRVKVHRPAVIG